MTRWVPGKPRGEGNCARQCKGQEGGGWHLSQSILSHKGPTRETKGRNLGLSTGASSKWGSERINPIDPKYKVYRMSILGALPGALARAALHAGPCSGGQRQNQPQGKQVRQAAGFLPQSMRALTQGPASPMEQYDKSQSSRMLFQHRSAKVDKRAGQVQDAGSENGRKRIERGERSAKAQALVKTLSGLGTICTEMKKRRGKQVLQNKQVY